MTLPPATTSASHWQAQMAALKLGNAAVQLAWVTLQRHWQEVGSNVGRVTVQFDCDWVHSQEQMDALKVGRAGVQFA